VPWSASSREGRTGHAEVRILLVEDQSNDVLLAKRAFGKILPGVLLDVAPDGEAAVSILETNAPSAPSHVLLDLKLPKKSGLEVLAWIRGTREIRSLPVVILTSSEEPSDVKQAKSLGVDRYCVKPLLYRDFVDLLRSICEDWGILDRNQVRG
jgi:CheY-like chemotaxis protein